MWLIIICVIKFKAQILELLRYLKLFLRLGWNIQIQSIYTINNVIVKDWIYSFRSFWVQHWPIKNEVIDLFYRFGKWMLWKMKTKFKTQTQWWQLVQKIENVCSRIFRFHDEKPGWNIMKHLFGNSVLLFSKKVSQNGYRVDK